MRFTPKIIAKLALSKKNFGRGLLLIIFILSSIFGIRCTQYGPIALKAPQYRNITKEGSYPLVPRQMEALSLSARLNYLDTLWITNSNPDYYMYNNMYLLFTD